MTQARRRLGPLLLLLLLLLLGGLTVTWVAIGPGEAPERLNEAETATAGTDLAAADDADGASEDDVRRRRNRVTPGAGGDDEQATGVDVGGSGGDDADDDAPSGGDVEGGAGTDEAQTDVARNAFAVRGRVLSGTDDAPVDGARILVAIMNGSDSLGWWGDTSAEDGSFHADLDGEWRERATHIEIRARQSGYELAIVPIGKPEGDEFAVPDIRLVALDRIPEPGRIRGKATDGDGRPLTGVLALNGYDAMGDNESLLVEADAAGEFEVPGVPPGPWTFGLDNGDGMVPVVVPDGGEATLHVTRSKVLPTSMTEEEFLAERSRLNKGLGKFRTDEARAGKDHEDERWRLMYEIQELEELWRLAQPRREVQVTGLDEHDGALVEARTTSGPNQLWRVEVENGVATFVGLTPETWEIVLILSTRSTVKRRVDVEFDEEPLTVELYSKTRRGDGAKDASVVR